VSAGADRPGFWRRRLGPPLRALLVQGLSPEGLALSLAVGVVLGLFPILGTTTLLCLVAGATLRLNHVALQLAQQLVYPLQLALILAFVRLGERLVGAPPARLAPRVLASRFFEDAPGFLREFGLTGLHGILGWSVVAPFLVAALVLVLRPALRRADATWRARRSSAATGTAEPV
jgi:uncharacterized protein (DUF2062 family)